MDRARLKQLEEDGCYGMDCRHGPSPYPAENSAHQYEARKMAMAEYAEKEALVAAKASTPAL